MFYFAAKIKILTNSALKNIYLKILHISSEKSWRGGEQQIAYLIEETTKEGHECAVVCRSDSAFEKYCETKGITQVSRSFNGVNVFTTAVFLRFYAKKHKFALVHVHSAKSHLVAFISLLLGSKIPVVLSRRVDFIPSTNWLTRWRYNHRGIKRIVGVSHAISEIMREYIDKAKDRCVTVHDGIDINKFGQTLASFKETYNIAEDKRVVANTSALADHKDYFTFLDTVRVLLNRRKDVAFIIFGTGPMEHEIKDYAEQIRVKDNVIFAGFVKNLPQILPQLDVFLMTSKTEGLGTSILDAFACKVPVVATRAGGIPEAVIDGKTGLLAEVGDKEALADQVERLLDNPQLRKEVTDGASAHLAGFTKEAMAEKTIAIYKEIV